VSRGRGIILWVVGVAALAVLPVVGLSGQLLSTAVSALALIALSQGFNLVFGYTGLLSFAQVAFWGIGAYAGALLVVNVGLSHWLAFIGAGIVAGASAFLLGAITLKLPRQAFIIITLAFLLLVQLLARDWTTITRGPLGIPNLPPPVLSVGPVDLTFDGPALFYELMLAYVVLVLAFMHRLVHSRIGRALNAIREDPSYARSQGLDVQRYRQLAFVTAAAISGMAGSLFVFHLTVVDPSIFGFFYLQAILIIVIVGGRGTFWPVVIGGAVLPFLPEVLRIAAELRLVIYGVVLVTVALFLPQGVGGWLDERMRRRRQGRPVVGEQLAAVLKQ
jgi:branched-chain amino acid transport system permease protein